MSDLIVTDYEGHKVTRYGSIILLGHFWSWTPYDKCSFRCVYCSVEAQGKSKPLFKPEDVPAVFEGFLPHQGKYPLAFGITADAYPAEEAEHRLMRIAIPEVERQGIRFSITTHGDMVARDIDLLVQCRKLETIGVSIPHRDDAMIRKFEPGSPGFESKRKAVYDMLDAGLPVHLNISPWIPGISDPDAIAREFPSDIKVNVSPLSYNKKQQIFTKHLFGRDMPSAERVFRKQFATQETINEAYLEAYRQVGTGVRKNMNWLAPPGMEQSIITKLA
jgi:DNA repair photolyase